MPSGRSAYPRRVPIVHVGSRCARRGCSRPDWKDGLCGRCWRLATMFGRDPALFAYEPLDGWADDRDAPPLPWDELERELLGAPRERGAGD